jgi:hypothetical protein
MTFQASTRSLKSLRVRTDVPLSQILGTLICQHGEHVTSWKLRNRVAFSAGADNFYFTQCLQTDSGAYPASCRTDTKELFTFGEKRLDVKQIAPT